MKSEKVHLGKQGITGCYRKLSVAFVVLKITKFIKNQGTVVEILLVDLFLDGVK